MVCRLVLRELLHVVSGGKPYGSRDWNPARVAGRVLATSNQSIPCSSSKQLAAVVCIHGLRNTRRLQRLVCLSSQITATCANNVAEAGANAKGMVAAVIWACGVEAKCVLAAEFVGNRVEYLLDLSAAINQTLGQQKRSPAAVFREGA